MPVTVASCALPSYVYRHSALSRASSRHSAARAVTGTDSDPGHGSADLFARRAVFRSPGFTAGRTGP
jgi:hypothetical protein